eukprot:jgi/Botrbrau1/4094/Bobra.152_3s0043.1
MTWTSIGRELQTRLSIALLNYITSQVIGIAQEAPLMCLCMCHMRGATCASVCATRASA